VESVFFSSVPLSFRESFITLFRKQTFEISVANKTFDIFAMSIKDCLNCSRYSKNVAAVLIILIMLKTFGRTPAESNDQTANFNSTQSIYVTVNKSLITINLSSTFYSVFYKYL